MALRLMSSLFEDSMETYCRPTIRLSPEQEQEEDADRGQSFDEREVLIHQVFWFCMLWTCGACTDADGRAYVCDMVRSVLDNKKDLLKKYNFFTDFNKVELTGTGTPPMPPRKGLIHDLFVDSTEGGKWKPWTDRIQGFDIAKDAQYHTIVVPTADTVRNQFFDPDSR